jgi:hypothetical protein
MRKPFITSAGLNELDKRGIKDLRGKAFPPGCEGQHRDNNG